MLYSPQSLVLTLSRQCNLRCGHCIVEAEPREREKLNLDLIDHVLSQARPIGINSVVIYGGEPLLHSRDLLPVTLHKIFEQRFPVSIGTNGFWGRTEVQAKRILTDLEKITSEHDGFISLGISVDKFHQPKIPSKSIANIIAQHRLGNFPHIKLGIQSFKEEESWDIVGEVFESCEQNGIRLIESNDSRYIYPALQNEFIEFTKKNFPLIAKNLKLPSDADEEVIMSWLRHYFSLMKQMQKILTPTVIARNVDIGNGEANYLLFPDSNYLIDFMLEKGVINAGRARKENEPLEMGFHYDNCIDYLVISPNGQAYAYPAQMTAEEGVFIGQRPLHEVVREVGKRITE